MDLTRLAVAAAIGAPLGTILGYFVYAAPSGYSVTRFTRWMFEAEPLDAVSWAIFGTAIALGLLYLSRRT